MTGDNGMTVWYLYIYIHWYYMQNDMMYGNVWHEAWSWYGLGVGKVQIILQLWLKKFDFKDYHQGICWHTVCSFQILLTPTIDISSYFAHILGENHGKSLWSSNAWTSASCLSKGTSFPSRIAFKRRFSSNKTQTSFYLWNPTVKQGNNNKGRW